MLDIARAAQAASALWLTALVALGSGTVVAQDAPALDYSDEELQTLVGPIALYPDDLVAIVLPASTYPLQIVQAARLLDDLEDDPSLEPDPEWDESVVALLNYPETLRLMSDDLDWTWALGEAVLAEQAAVLDAIQDFRDQAYAAGNLQSDDRQIVSQEGEVISIEPADPEVVYIPYYEPERVIVYQPRPVYHYYPVAYPLYYYPYPVGHHFYRTGFFWGVTSAFSIGWHTHYVHLHHHSHIGHPYYGFSYYTPYYVRRSVGIIHHDSHIWRSTYRYGSRPHRHHTDRQITVSRERYVHDGDRARRPASARTVTTEGRTAARSTARAPRPEAAARTSQSRQRAIGGIDQTAPGARSRTSDRGTSAAPRQATGRADRAAERAAALRSTANGANRLGNRLEARSSTGQRPARTTAPSLRSAPRSSNAGASRVTRGSTRSATVPRPSRSARAPSRSLGGVARTSRSAPSQRSAPAPRSTQRSSSNRSSSNRSGSNRSSGNGRGSRQAGMRARQR